MEVRKDYLIGLEDAVVAVKDRVVKLSKTSLTHEDETKLQSALDGTVFVKVY